ncbi:MAG: TIGR03757 family integrating conjugative element protein [Halomonas sp.]|nr:TIGR03757 family integrating conjugative element protein [Halomonas sp.]
MSFQIKLHISPVQCLAFLPCFLLPIVAMATEVWVITDQQHPVTGKYDRLIALDAPQLIEGELSADLPLDKKVAAVVIHQRIKQGGLPLQRQIQMAYQGIVDAWSLGIVTVPAVIVDQRYVVYGVSDVDQALAGVELYRRGQP